MKFWIITLLISIIVIVLFFPLVNIERLCYETSQRNLDDISESVLNLRASMDMECGQRMDVLFNLETCMQDATKSSAVAPYVYDVVGQIVAIIRPYGKNLWTLKTEHNQECSDFSWYQLP